MTERTLEEQLALKWANGTPIEEILDEYRTILANRIRDASTTYGAQAKIFLNAAADMIENQPQKMSFGQQ